MPADLDLPPAKIYRNTVIQRGGEEVYRRRPTAKKLVERFGAESPLGAEDLRLAAQRIRQHLQLARNKVRKQLNVMDLAQTKDGLRHRVESLRAGAPLLLQVRQRRGVVGVENNNLALMTGEETPDSVENRQQLPVVDRKVGAIRPQAGQLVIF